ncbi:MAG: hypothetical protein KC501_18080 [Myxococcales bacterium]|nr:hypothetical protein [Myxococcales bacterium]
MLSTVLATLPAVASAHVGPASASLLALAPTDAAAQPAQEEEEAKEEEERRPRREKGLVLRGFGKTGTAVLPGVGFGGGLSVGWLRKRFRLDLMGSGRLDRSVWYAGDQAVGGDFSLWRVGLRGCAALGSGRVATPICLGADTGMVTASGSGVASARTERQPWGSVFADIDLVWHVLPNFGLVTTSRWMVPLVRNEYYIGDRGTLVTTPPFGVEIGLGLELVLP